MLREEGGFYDRDPRDYKLRIALVYPAPYMAAINSLGHQIVYFLLNSYDDVMAERFVSDLKGSVESGRSIDEFDVALASLHFEGQYPILLRMLEGFKKPVILGGPAVSANPIPMSLSSDAIGIGDSELLVPPLVESLLEGEFSSLSDIGFFVPSMMNKAVFRRVSELRPLKTQLLVIRDGRPVNPFLLEISRGCGWGCRFCMLGWHQRPRLDLKASYLEEAIDSAVEHGFNSIYVIGSDASSSRLIKDLLHTSAEKGLKVSLPSIRADHIDAELIELALESGENMLTLAPETGSPRMKVLINKMIDNDEVIKVAEEMRQAGMRHLKLYFMVGLPREEDEDIESSAILARKVKSLIDTKVTLSIFVPKPGTPFEEEPLAPEIDIRRRISAFKKLFGGRVNAMHYGRAYLQTLLSVGDFRIAKLLTKAYRLPYNRGAYRELAKRLSIDVDSIVYGQRETPWWDLIETGIKREYVLEERRRAFQWRTTPSCDEYCTGCMRECWLYREKGCS